MARKRLNNYKLFSKAKKYLVAGVNSPVRSFKYAGGKPLLIEKGRGSLVYDYDGNRYIDYVLSWGSLILGHSHPRVISQLKKTINSGLSFGTTNRLEVELAELILKAIPFAEKIRFVNSGTEAVTGALRLSRGYTGRSKIVKFEHAYHGHADYLLASSGSGLATLSIAQSLGVPKDFIKHTITLPYGDRDYLDRVFDKYGSEIAAVIFEPVGANYGVQPPDIAFLKYLRKITKRYKTLLVADEIVSGFRFNFGALTAKLGIIPDIICLGKIIGGGLPIGAYAGKDKVMRYLAPEGKVYQASTFSGNPVVMQAGVSTLKVLYSTRNQYARLVKLTEGLAKQIEQEAGLRKIVLKISYYGSLFSLKFEEKEDFRKFYQELLRQGIYFAQSEYEASFLSFAHNKNDITITQEAIKNALEKIRSRRG